MEGRVFSHRTTWIAAPLLFVSGFCALIYQVVWTRELRLVFGATTAASSAVVAIFIAGLGFGGLWFGRRVERSAHPLRFYALLELAIALFSALTPLLLYAVSELYVWTGGSLRLGPSGSSLVRLALATVVLGPPTFLMGGTLPAIARAIETDGDRARRGVAAVYGVNTLGAVLGCAISTFVWLEQFGGRLTLLIACGLNLLVAALAYGLSRRVTPPAVTPLSSADADGSATAAASAPAPLVFASAALVGFAFFLMELVWYRILQPVLGGTVFTFGLILALALIGIGLGSALYAALLSGRRMMLLGFAMTCVAEAACLSLPFALGDRLAIWAALLRPLGNLGFHGLVFGWAVIAGCVVLPAALVAGFQFPLLIALLGSGRSQVGRHVGSAYAANTLGAVLGALAGGFGLLPALGALGCWRLAAGLLAGWGLLVGAYAFMWKDAPRARSLQTGWVLVLFALSVLMLRAEGPTAAFRHSPVGAGRVPPDTLASPTMTEDWLRLQRRAISWQTDGIESAIGISRHDGVAFIVNGKSDGNSRADAATQVMGGLVGAALRPEVKRAMVIGLGTGSTAGWLAQLPEIERVDVAELEPAVLEVARECSAVNHDVLSNSKVKIHQGDARELLTVSRSRYDLIFSEPSNPYRAGVASLYTREYYRAVKRHLTRNGVFVQWLQAYEVDARTLRTIYATLNSAFPYVETFHGRTHDLLLVATRKRPVHDVAALEARLKQPPFPEAMRAAWYTEGVEGFLSHYLANPSFARAVAGEQPVINTDDRTAVEFGFARNLRNDPRVTAKSFFASIRARGENRPELRGRSVDWERIDFEHEAFGVATGIAVSDAHLTERYRERLAMLSRWWQGDHADVAAIWDQLGRGLGELSPLAIERRALAEAFAYVGGADVEPWIRALTADQPTLGAALHAVWQMQHGDRQQGSEELVSALRRYRSDPWPISEQMARVVASLHVRTESDRELAPRWLDALSQPFASSVIEVLRLQARVNIGHTLGPTDAACVAVLKDMEPHVPWMEAVLEYRADCYRLHGHPSREVAAKELVQFRATAPESFDHLTPD
jgi:spermidine synthase